VTQRKNVSDATAKLIDEEVRRLVDTAEAQARTILTTHVDKLHQIAKGLLEFETLSGAEIRGLMKGEPIVRPDIPEPPADAGTRSAVPPTRGPAPKPGGLAPTPQPGG
jgi:cell division protease FtsH